MLAARQHGVVTWEQLLGAGLSRATITRWIAGGRLHRVYPGVYAVGHTAMGTEGGLIAALLYAGRGSALSRVTALWWWELVEDQPGAIHISTPNRRGSRPGVVLHHPRELNRVFHRGLPVTPVARTLLDASPSLPFNDLRGALAEAEFRGWLDPDELSRATGRGRVGSARLRRALANHLPALAQTRSALEQRFVLLCEKAGIRMPEVNVKVAGFTVDCLWRAERLVVELDGRAAHDSDSRLEADRRRDLALRRAGFTVLRYTWQQLTGEPDLVIADLRAALDARVRAY